MLRPTLVSVIGLVSFATFGMTPTTMASCNDAFSRMPHCGFASSPKPSLLHLRPALPEDAPLLKIWDEEPHVKENSGDDDYNGWNWDDAFQEESEWKQQGQLGWRQSLIADVATNDNDMHPVGFVQIMDPHGDPEQYWGPECAVTTLRAIDIWIGEGDYLSKGFGTEMMKQALEMCFSEDVSMVLVDPMAHNVRAHAFYQRLGFEPDGQHRWFGPDKCLVHRLSRERWMDYCQHDSHQ